MGPVLLFGCIAVVIIAVGRLTETGIAGAYGLFFLVICGLIVLVSNRGFIAHVLAVSAGVTIMLLHALAGLIDAVTSSQ